PSGLPEHRGVRPAGAEGAGGGSDDFRLFAAGLGSSCVPTPLPFLRLLPLDFRQLGVCQVRRIQLPTVLLRHHDVRHGIHHASPSTDRPTPGRANRRAACASCRL
ncbi:hypothetical protein TGFOU_209120B, partial [Toxoplasma gondii FOU]